MATMKRMIAVLMIVLMAATASAQSVGIDRLTPALPTQTERTIADIASYGTVGTALFLDFRKALKADDRAHELELFGARLFATWVVTTALKELAHRDRPCAPNCGFSGNDVSFPSGHTAFAFTASWRWGTATAAGRITSNKHWLTDTLAGALIGSAIGHTIRTKDSK